MKNLFKAIYENNNAEVERLLDSGTNPNALNEMRCYPLFEAVRRNNIEIVNLLIDHKAKVDQVNYTGTACVSYYEREYTALHLAVAMGNIDIIRALLNAGANYNVHSFHGSSPLLMTVENLHLERFRVFLPFLTKDELFENLEYLRNLYSGETAYINFDRAITDEIHHRENWSPLREAWCGAVALSSINRHGLTRDITIATSDETKESGKKRGCSIS